MSSAAPLHPTDYPWKITESEGAVRATTGWLSISTHRGRVRGQVIGRPLNGYIASIATVRGKVVHRLTGVFNRLSEAQENVEAWLNRNSAVLSPQPNRHEWGVVSSGSAAVAGGVAEVHQCQHGSCGKFRVISSDVDQDRLYTYRQLMAAYPDIEWD